MRRTTIKMQKGKKMQFFRIYGKKKTNVFFIYNGGKKVSISLYFSYVIIQTIYPFTY